ncbi:aspartate/glutamate racemase family protein [Aliiroseovarius sp. S1339]|uniref:aspartate/glutamate racemase family protein n=1 Tax=Aliiroseovarius sp. S1339 TaxID=2936990 RepID=UPI0020C13EBE|nr:aspartate/glutamate racemase family protein [Aliiroseovarius sp. S1339]MCK8464468.1 aspartate/glutamate racemase family protein [Aliiroseovarius sp. S1339]
MGKAAVGILMLETSFPRPLGDIGHQHTWDFPVHMRAVGGASAQKVVHEDPRALLDGFVQVGRELIADGCAGLTTSCGFLSLMQDELKDALGVPFASSPLMQVPMVEATLPTNQEAGILTISKESLSAAHLRAAGARDDLPIEGLPRDGAFATAVFDDLPDMNFAACQAEMHATAQRLVLRRETVGAIVLECTNMAPYAADIAKITGRPVYSIVSFLNWFQAGLAPTRY